MRERWKVHEVRGGDTRLRCDRLKHAGICYGEVGEGG